MKKYIVHVGFNTPDPTGKRDSKGRPVEVRFEAGDEITETSVSVTALKSLLQSGVVEDPAAAEEQRKADEEAARKAEEEAAKKAAEEAASKSEAVSTTAPSTAATVPHKK